MNCHQYVNAIVGAVADIPDIYTGTVPAGGGKTYPGLWRHGALSSSARTPSQGATMARDTVITTRP